MAKLNIQQLLLQFSVSHDPSEIILICWFGAQEMFLIIISATFDTFKVSLLSKNINYFKKVLLTANLTLFNGFSIIYNYLS